MGAYPGHNVTVGNKGSGSSSSSSGSGSGGTIYGGQVIIDSNTGAVIKGQDIVNRLQHPGTDYVSSKTLNNYGAGYGGGQSKAEAAPLNTPQTIAAKAHAINAQIQQAQHWKNEGIPADTSYENLNLALNNPVYNQGVVREAIRQKQLRQTAARYPLGPRVAAVPEEALQNNPDAVAVGSYPYAQYYVNPFTGAKYAGMAAAVEREQLRERGLNPDFIRATRPSMSEASALSTLGGEVGGSGGENTLLAPTFRNADISYGVGFGGAFEKSVIYSPPMVGSDVAQMNMAAKASFSAPSGFGWAALGGILEQNAGLRLNPLGGTLKTLSGMGKGLASYVGYEVGKAVVEPIMTKYYDFTSGVASKLPSSLQEPFLATAQTPGPPIFNTMLYYGGKDFRERFYRSQGISSADIRALEASTMAEKFGSGGTFGQFSISLGKEAAGFAAAGGVGYAVNKALEAAPQSVLGGKVTPYFTDINKGAFGVFSGGGETQVPRNIERVFLTPKGLKQFTPKGQPFIDQLTVMTGKEGTEFKFTRQAGDMTYEMGSTRPIPTGMDQYSTPYVFPKRAAGSMVSSLKVSPAGVRLPGGSAGVTFARGQVTLASMPSQDYTAEQIYKLGPVGGVKLRGIVSQFEGGRVSATVAQEAVRFPERPPKIPNVEVLPKVTLMPRGPMGGKLFKELYSTQPKFSVSPQGLVSELKPTTSKESAAFIREVSATYRQASSGYSIYKLSPIYGPGVAYESATTGGRMLSNVVANFGAPSSAFQTLQANVQTFSKAVGVGQASSQALTVRQLMRNVQKTIGQASAVRGAQSQIQYAGNVPASLFGVATMPASKQITQDFGPGVFSFPSFKFPRMEPFKFPGVPPAGGGGFAGGRSLFRGQFKIRNNPIMSGEAALLKALSLPDTRKKSVKRRKRNK